ncbi:MAG: NAD(P)H-dependent oxidoreductase [Magnetococcales bacterium]|nr:NAD(P)H-dependent oxidoreductase [Magnetococcales bacterium]
MSRKNVTILGVVGSLRNARFGRGSDALVEEIQELKSQEALVDYLKEQSAFQVEAFLAAGRKENLPFDMIYRNLRKNPGDKGLSNSEAGLAAALWGACQEGARIRHVGLASHFPMSGEPKNIDQLKQVVLAADALLISGPVYFGDRSSLLHEFIELLRHDPDLKRHCQGRVYAGVSVGAKRNGGQETSLIYQIIDLSNLNMLALGNSAETTAQYGGTLQAGDVGTVWKDSYGLNTAIGSGKRLARVAGALSEGVKWRMKEPVRVGIWIVQDSADKRGQAYVQRYIEQSKNADVAFDVIDLTEEKIARCIACDLCPTHHAPVEEYACIIGGKEDFFVQHHARLVSADAVLLMAYSPIDRAHGKSVYQRFIERTRYIRRGHYMLSDRLVAPFVISEINTNQNLHIRMLTSLIRHHAILHHPIIGLEQNGALLNMDYSHHQFELFLQSAVQTTIARIGAQAQRPDTQYNPIGYVISPERDQMDAESGRLTALAREKRENQQAEKTRRLEALE